MAKPTEPVLSATERMLVEKQKMQIKSMRMTQEQLELFRLQRYEQKMSRNFKMKDSRDTFVIFDKDGDGTIDSKELSTVLKSMGYNPTKEEIQDMVDEVDSDGSGSIEFLEFLLLMGKILKDVPTDADLRDVFTVFDKDRSGFASSSEIKTVMSNLGVHFTDDEIQEMMIEVDLE